MWDFIYSFILVEMVYAAAIIFAAGFAARIFIALRSPNIKGTLGAFPKEKSRALGILNDSFFMPSVFKKDKVFWTFIVLFHGAFLLLIIGHLELIREFDIIQIIEHKVFLGAGFVGITLIISTLYFLFRRFRSPHNGISVPEDYLLLILLFLTMISGSHMNLASTYGISGFDIPVEDYRTYLSSLISLNPIIPEGITESPHYVIVALHIFFANIFIMIFPFSKMIHSVFIFLTQNIKRK